MDKHTLDRLPHFLDVLGLDEAPMGIFYTDTKPKDGFSPKPNDLPTREKEMLQRFDASFLKTKTWSTVQKKIARSQKAWGEVEG